MCRKHYLIWYKVLAYPELKLWATNDISSEFSPSLAVTSLTAAPSKFSVPVVGFALGQLELDFEEVELQFHNLKHPRNSFEMRVFLNQQLAKGRTLPTFIFYIQ